MKNKLVLTLIFLCVIMIALIGPRFLGRGPGAAKKDATAPGKSRSRRSRRTEVTIRKSSPEEMKIWLEERKKFIYRPQDRRDPFNPLIFGDQTERAHTAGIKLRGIISDPEDPLAESEISGHGTRIIHKGDLIKGGRIILKEKAGEEQGGIKVIDIQGDMIILQEGTRKITIKMK